MNELQNEYRDTYAKAVIIGNGPSAIKISENEPNTLYIGINQGLNLIDHPTLLALNDYENILTILPEKLNKIRYIVSPYYPHIKGKVNKNITWENIEREIKNKIENYQNYSSLKLTNKKIDNKIEKGTVQWFLHNLWTSTIKHEQYPSLGHSFTTTDTLIEYLPLLFKNLKKINCYGICKKNGYNESVKKIHRETVNDTRYPPDYQQKLIKKMTTSLKKYGITINFN